MIEETRRPVSGPEAEMPTIGQRVEVFAPDGRSLGYALWCGFSSGWQREKDSESEIASWDTPENGR